MAAECKGRNITVKSLGTEWTHLTEGELWAKTLYTVWQLHIWNKHKRNKEKWKEKKELHKLLYELKIQKNIDFTQMTTAIDILYEKITE